MVGVEWGMILVGLCVFRLSWVRLQLKANPCFLNLALCGQSKSVWTYFSLFLVALNWARVVQIYVLFMWVVPNLFFYASGESRLTFSFSFLRSAYIGCQVCNWLWFLFLYQPFTPHPSAEFSFQSSSETFLPRSLEAVSCALLSGPHWSCLAVDSAGALLSFVF